MPDPRQNKRKGKMPSCPTQRNIKGKERCRHAWSNGHVEGKEGYPRNLTWNYHKRKGEEPKGLDPRNMKRKEKVPEGPDPNEVKWKGENPWWAPVIIKEERVPQGPIHKEIKTGRCLQKASPQNERWRGVAWKAQPIWKWEDPQWASVLNKIEP